MMRNISYHSRSQRSHTEKPSNKQPAERKTLFQSVFLNKQRCWSTNPSSERMKWVHTLCEQSWHWTHPLWVFFTHGFKAGHLLKDCVGNSQETSVRTGFLTSPVCTSPPRHSPLRDSAPLNLSSKLDLIKIELEDKPRREYHFILLTDMREYRREPSLEAFLFQLSSLLTFDFKHWNKHIWLFPQQKCSAFLFWFKCINLVIPQKKTSIKLKLQPCCLSEKQENKTWNQDS